MDTFRQCMSLFVLCACVLADGLLSSGWAQTQPQRDASREASSATEAAVRKSAEAYCESFNQRDAKAIAAHWDQDALYVNEDGERFQGREAIEKEHEQFFQLNPEATLTLEIESIRTINENTAIEEGIATLGPQPVGAPRIASRYVAIHVKKGSQWLIAEMRDSRIDLGLEPAKLSELDWLVGTWAAESTGTRLRVTYQWMDGKKFLMRRHEGKRADSDQVMSGIEIIGLDPASQQITSWLFSSDGSTASATWLPTKDGWQSTYEGNLADGTSTFAINTLSRSTDKGWKWQSTQRSAGTDRLPDTPEVEFQPFRDK